MHYTFDHLTEHILTDCQEIRWALQSFLNLLNVFAFFNVKGTASHMTEAEYLKVNLPMLVLTCGR